MTAPSRELSPLQSLVERLEGASGPDREIDTAIALWQHPELAKWPRAAHGGWDSPGWGLIAPPERYTDSLDSALALVERCKPDWVGPIELCIAGSAEAYLTPRDPCGLSVKAIGATPALALVTALLKAVQAQETLGRRNDGASKPENTDV